MQQISVRKEAGIVHELKRGAMRRREIAEEYGVSESTVTLVARRNGIKSTTWHRWTEEEDELLREMYYELGPRRMAHLLPNHRNESAICHHAKALGLTTRMGPFGRRRREVTDG